MVVGIGDDEVVDRLFGALADATRRDILRRSMNEAHSVSSLARFYPISFAAVQKHVAALERAHLVTKKRRGREQLVRSNIETLHVASQLLDQLESVWRGRLDRIDDVLGETTKGAHP